jgi:hypothetical protein
MKTANQLTFTTYESSLKLKPNDPTKVIFDTIDWSFIHSLHPGSSSVPWLRHFNLARLLSSFA